MIDIFDSHDKIYLEDINKLESKNNINLPNKFKDFLLKWNGGTPEPSLFKISDEEGSSVMNYFYSIGDTYYDIEDYLDIYDLRLPNGFIAIGDDPGGNAILVGTKEPYYDQIYFWDHEEEQDEPNMSNMYFLANDIWEFLDSLYEDTEMEEN